MHWKKLKFFKNQEPKVKELGGKEVISLGKGKFNQFVTMKTEKKIFFVISVVHNITVRIIHNFNSSNPQIASLTLVTFWA